METKVIRLEVRFTRPTQVALLGLVQLAVVGLLLWALGSVATGSGGEGKRPPQAAQDTAAIVGNRIHYQGRLEGANGPVQMTFSLYGDEAGALLLWAETKEVTPDRGLINVELGDTTELPWGLFDGRELWLGVGAGDAGEMRPLQEVLPVPYALSLRPGAKINGSSHDQHTLLVENQADSGAYAAIYGETYSPEGYGGHFANPGGTALLADGRFECTQFSTIWFPGTLARERIGTSGLTLSYHGDGLVRLDATTSGSKQIVIPLSVPSTMYGSPTRLQRMYVYFRCHQATSSNYIDKLIVYRQGAGGSHEIATDETDHLCLGTERYLIPLDGFTDPELSALNGVLTLELTAQMGAGDRLYVGGASVEFYNY